MIKFRDNRAQSAYHRLPKWVKAKIQDKFTTITVTYDEVALLSDYIYSKKCTKVVYSKLFGGARCGRG